MSNETKNSIYATARYSLLIDDQITFESLTKTKEQIFNSWLEQLYEDKHTTINIGQDQYIIYCVKVYDTTYILNFAKNKEETIGVMTDTDIQSQSVPNYVNFYIPINTARQIILIQKALKFSVKFDTQKNDLVRALNEIFEPKGLTISIDFITEKQEFWNFVKENKGSIKKLEIQLTARNFLGSIRSVTELLDECKKSFNNTSTKLSFSNDQGNLKIPEDDEFINDAVSYSSSGCGSWKITTNDKSRSLSSTNRIAQQTIDIDNISNLTADDILHLRKAFDNINSIDDTNLNDDTNLK